MFWYFVTSVNGCRAGLRPVQRLEDDAAVLGGQGDRAGSTGEEDETGKAAKGEYFQQRFFDEFSPTLF
jgi:hypothetical protein